MANVQHADLTSDADLHHPRGAISAAADLVYVSDGAGGGSFQAYPDADGVGDAKGIVNQAADIGALTDSTGETANDTIVDVEFSDTTTDLTDNSGGTASDTLADITEANNAGSADRVPTEDAIASLAAKINAIHAHIALIEASIDLCNENFSDLADHINDIRGNMRAAGQME